MKYVKLVIAISDEYQESLIAQLFDMDFDAFEQQEDAIITYITKERFTIDQREYIEELLAAYPGDGYIHSEEVVADQNWNKQWEQSIQAQNIGRFFIKPTWSKAALPDQAILLEIDPKMAFGTGYHETTRLMLYLLPEVIERGERVLDAGTGTGILAIASVKLGASHVFAFDIDDWSFTNARENILLNKVEDRIEIHKGSEEVIPEEQYDVVLANIERNVILRLLPVLSGVLKPGGHLLLSGLLDGDLDQLSSHFKSYPFHVEDIRQDNGWIAFHLTNGST